MAAEFEKLVNEINAGQERLTELEEQRAQYIAEHGLSYNDELGNILNLVREEREKLNRNNRIYELYNRSAQKIAELRERRDGDMPDYLSADTIELYKRDLDSEIARTREILAENMPANLVAEIMGEEIPQEETLEEEIVLGTGTEGPGMPSIEEQYRMATGEEFNPDEVEVVYDGASGEDYTDEPMKDFKFVKKTKAKEENESALVTGFNEDGSPITPDADKLGISSTNRKKKPESSTKTVEPIKKPEENKDDEYKPIPVNQSLVPVEPKKEQGEENKDDGYTPIPVNKSLVPVEPTKGQDKATDEPAKARTLDRILHELQAGLNLDSKDLKHFKASNIKVLPNFKKELNSGNYLYNIVHLSKVVLKTVAFPINWARKAIGRIKSARSKERVEELQKRIQELSEADVKVLAEEYVGKNRYNFGRVSIADYLINQRVSEWHKAQADKLNKDIVEKHQEVYSRLAKLRAIDAKLDDQEVSKDIKAELQKQKAEIIKGSADIVRTINEEHKEAENHLNGGGEHSFAENTKAALSKMNLVGMRFAKEHSNDETNAKQADLADMLEKAISEKDDLSALYLFAARERLIKENTKTEKSILGTISTGERVFSPTAGSLDYRDDPFVRDLISTIALTSATISAINAINVHSGKLDDINNSIEAANKQNADNMAKVQETVDYVNDQKSHINSGMEATAHQDVIMTGNTLERWSLDANGWVPHGDAYRAMDSANHATTHEMYDSVCATMDNITKQVQNGSMSQSEAMHELTELTSDLQTQFSGIVDSYLPVLKDYAKNNSFDLAGVEGSLSFIQQNPDAITKMFESVDGTIHMVDGLDGMTAAYAETLSTLPSDLLTTLVADAAVVAMAAIPTNQMAANYSNQEYNNAINDMIDDYSAKSEAPKETGEASVTNSR